MFAYEQPQPSCSIFDPILFCETEHPPTPAPTLPYSTSRDPFSFCTEKGGTFQHPLKHTPAAEAAPPPAESAELAGASQELGDSSQDRETATWNMATSSLGGRPTRRTSGSSFKRKPRSRRANQLNDLGSSSLAPSADGLFTQATLFQLCGRKDRGALCRGQLTFKDKDKEFSYFECQLCNIYWCHCEACCSWFKVERNRPSRVHEHRRSLTHQRYFPQI